MREHERGDLGVAVKGIAELPGYFAGLQRKDFPLAFDQQDDRAACGIEVDARVVIRLSILDRYWTPWWHIAGVVRPI